MAALYNSTNSTLPRKVVYNNNLRINKTESWLVPLPRKSRRAHQSMQKTKATEILLQSTTRKPTGQFSIRTFNISNKTSAVCSLIIA